MRPGIAGPARPWSVASPEAVTPRSHPGLMSTSVARQDPYISVIEGHHFIDEVSKTQVISI